MRSMCGCVCVCTLVKHNNCETAGAKICKFALVHDWLCASNCETFWTSSRGLGAGTARVLDWVLARSEVRLGFPSSRGGASSTKSGSQVSRSLHILAQQPSPNLLSATMAGPLKPVCILAGRLNTSKVNTANSRAKQLTNQEQTKPRSPDKFSTRQECSTDCTAPPNHVHGEATGEHGKEVRHRVVNLANLRGSRAPIDQCEEILPQNHRCQDRLHEKWCQCYLSVRVGGAEGR